MSSYGIWSNNWSYKAVWNDKKHKYETTKVKTQSIYHAFYEKCLILPYLIEKFIHTVNNKNVWNPSSV
jgi:hypothetical protein